MIQILSLRLIFVITAITTGAISEEQTAAQLCKNPLVTSATKTPYGVLCLIPKPIDRNGIEKRQFVTKLIKYQQNDNLYDKIVPVFKPLRSPFAPQTNSLSKRHVFSDWLQKFSESLYKTFYKSLQKSLFRNTNSHSETQSLPQMRPESYPLPIAEGLHMGQDIMSELTNQLPQESQLLVNSQLVHKPDSLSAPDFAQSIISSTNQDESPDYIPLQSFNNDVMTDPVIDETRLGEASLDWPHYNYGSVRQLATYLQSIQEKINRQKFKDVKHSDDEEVVNKFRGLSGDNANDKHEVVIPLYTDVKVKEKTTDRTGSASEPVRHIVRNPRKLVYEFHGYKRDMDCKGRFKPLKSDMEKEQPVLRTRRKRYIEVDYNQMQLRKLPVWFNRNDENTLSEAIVEVKPRSLFRWEQPMIGWRPLVPPEMMRKDLFLKRNGDPLEHWDHEQVESQAKFDWLKTDVNSTQTDNKTKTDAKTPEDITIESLKNLDSIKSSVIIDRRNYGNKGLSFEDKEWYSSKAQDISDKPMNGKYDNEELVFKRRPDSQLDNLYDNQVITSDSNSGLKAVEVENVGEDITNAKSLEDIAAIPGAVIKPIDPKLTDILLKVLSHNSDFAQKRITNAYFLEFPKLPEYRPPPRPVPKTNFIYPDQIYSDLPAQMGVESTVNANNYEFDFDKDIQMTEADYEYGEIVCANKNTGAVADVRKGCQIYFQCTQYTIDTYVCPRGSRFDNRRQYCLPTNQVICG